nr:RecName: Full=Unknown protein from spot 119 of 2D-PAGE of thylakoid [Pisum sativum]
AAQEGETLTVEETV